MFIRSSDQLPTVTVLKRFPVEGVSFADVTQANVGRRFAVVLWWTLAHWLLHACAFWLGVRAVGLPPTAGGRCGLAAGGRSRIGRFARAPSRRQCTWRRRS